MKLSPASLQLLGVAGMGAAALILYTGNRADPVRHAAVDSARASETLDSAFLEPEVVRTQPALVQPQAAYARPETTPALRALVLFPSAGIPLFTPRPVLFPASTPDSASLELKPEKCSYCGLG